MHPGEAMSYPAIPITDVDGDGVEIHAFDLTPNVLPQTVLGLVRDRVVADVERIEPDFPEHHVALVQPLRSRENGDEIELFTPRVVDMEAQLTAAVDGFKRGYFAIVIDGAMCQSLDESIQLGNASCVRFVRYNMLIGG